MSLYICKDEDLAKDIVQEMYLKLHNRTNIINDAYVYFVIKNLFLDLKRKKDNKVELTDNIIQDLEDYNFEQDAKEQYILDEVEKLKYFEREILKVTQIISQRELSRQTDISIGVIKKCVKKTKTELWQKLKK